MTQYVIDTGEFPNDGTGDPLRTAFEYVNLNFNQIFNAGPVLSNIVIENNTIYSINTNGNIILNPNGIGNVIANAHVIPDRTRTRNLGAPELVWDTVYAQYFVGDGNGISNVTAASISNGSARVDAYFNGNVTVTANGVANVAVFTVNGLVVPNTVLAGTLSGNVTTTNISGQSITITATGNNQGISLAPNGTGNISVNFRHIVNLAEPVNPQDAATKYYVDTVAEGLDVKASCALATAIALPPYVYNNGSAGIGATITGNATGLLSIDSTAVTANARVLIKNEAGANEPYNGIYIVTTTGNATAAFRLIRSTDFDNGAPSGEIPGAFTFIETGATNADSGWVCTTNNPVTIGTTAILWTQFSGAGSYMPGQGLDLVGSEFNVLVDNDTTEINLNNQVAVKPGANLVTPNIGSATGTSLSITGALTANSVNISGAISTTANISGGNLLTTGVVSATSNITGGNIASLGVITASGNIISASNILGANLSTSGTVSAVGNIQGGNLIATANIVSGNVLTTGVVSATGNITGGNVVTAGTVSATGNITSAANVTGGNVLTSGTVSAIGNIQGANLVAVSNIIGGNLSISGQISAGGNILFGTGDISGTGNIYANKIFANIQGNIDAAGNVTEIQFNTTGDQLGANSNFTYDFANNIFTVNNGNIVGGNLLTSGVVSATGNITGGNLFILGQISATSQIITPSDITGGNINTAGQLSATGNVNGGNLVTSNTVVANNVVASSTVSAGGNITGANLTTVGTVAAATANISGNVNSGNILNSGIVSASGNVIGGNIRTAGQITATGNITVGNVRTAGLISAGGEIIANGNIAGAIVSAIGNIISDQYFIGNGAFLTGIDATSIQNGNSNVRVQANANVTVGVAGVSNVAVFANTGLFISGIVTATGNIIGANIVAENATMTGTVTAGNLISNTLSGVAVAVTSTGNLTLSATGNISVGNTYINNLANPVNLQDAATKYYVDTVATGLDPKESVVYATAVTLGVPYTYNNGVSGVGATLTANLPGNLTIDGNVIQSGQRVLVKNETGAFVSNTAPSAAFNGIYDVAVAGNAGTAWVLTRSADFDQADEMISSFTFVEEGATNADTGWVCVTNNPITVGFTSIVFTQFSGAGTYLAGNGLSLNGTVFNVNTDGNIAINGSNQLSIANGAVLNNPNITNAIATSVSATGNITGNYILGNGALLTGVITSVANINNGNSNVTISGPGSDVTVGVGGTSNVMVISPTDVTITGNLTVTGNATLSGNILGDRIQNGNTQIDIQTTGGNANVSVGGVANVAVFATTGVFVTGVSSVSGNVTGANIFTSGGISATGNITGSFFIGNGSQLTGVTADNVNANNLTGNTLSSNVLFSSLTSVGTLSNLSVAGNVTAANFIGNISGNIDAGGSNTQIQFNDADILAGSAAFTFDKTSNLVTVTGNVSAGNVTSQGIVTATLGVYGDIYTTSIDSADSSAVIVTPDMILLASLDVNQDITVGNIVIPSYGNITVGNVRIANLATPIFNQDAVNKQYVDSAIGNVLPIITNQTIDPDGSSVTYTLDQSTTAVGVLVTINGISQTPNDSYTVTGNAITFAELLLTSDIVQVRFLSGSTNNGVVYTANTLPGAGAAGPGARAFVNDSTTTSFYSTVTGGGANFVPVFSTGTVWRVG
jgi:hypothetical protein